MCYSPLRRDLFVLWGGWGERKRERAGHDGKGEGEKRPLPHNVRFTGRICGSVVLAKPADYLDAFEDCCKDNAFSLFPSSPARFPFFSIIAIFIGISSGSLGRGENGRAALKACWLTLFFILRIPKILRVLAQDVPSGSIIK